MTTASRDDGGSVVAETGLRALDGSETDRGFEELYLAVWPRLYRYVWLMVRHHEDAEDVASETVRRAYEAWQRGRGPRGEPLPWLFLIARRIVIDRSRRRLVPRLALGSVAVAPASDDLLRDSEATIWFDQLRACLNPRQHEALMLRYLFDLGDDRIGALMGLSPAGVRTLVSRSLTALRQRPEVLS
jgi:RNA polymerase sigma factor (sigma-70 family)